MTRTIRRRRWAWHEEAFASPLTPGISIVVPAYNEETVILESVRSLLAQRYSLFEVVVVDDGSTDETARTLIDAYDLRQVTPAARNKLRYEPVTEMYRGAPRTTSRSSARRTAAAPTRSTPASTWLGTRT